MTIYIKPEEVAEYTAKYRNYLQEVGLPEEVINMKVEQELKNNVVLIYTKEWQDENLAYWISTIQDVPGGYWIVQDLIHQPHCEYEHYRWKHKMSYEKNNVGNATAKRELSPKNYEIYQISERLRDRIHEFEIKSTYKKPKHL